MQVVNEPRPVELPLIDLSDRPASQRETESQKLFRELTRRCFNLAEDLMVRGALLRLGDNDHMLLLVTHQRGTAQDKSVIRVATALHGDTGWV